MAPPDSATATDAMDATRELERLRRLLDGVPAMLGYWDRNLNNVVANHRYLDYFGLTVQQIRGMHLSELLGEELFELNRPFIEGVLHGQEQQFDRVLTDTTGKDRHTHTTYVPDVVDGFVQGFFVQVADITERVLAERERDEAVELFRVAMDNAPIGKGLLDTAGRWIHVNTALCSLLGYSQTELLTLSFRDFVHPDEVEDSDELRAQLLSGTRTHVESERRYVRKDRSVVWVQRNAALVRRTNGPDVFIAQIQDISARKHTEEMLERQASTDELTGLGNRRFFMCRMMDRTHCAHTSATGLLFIDLDEFKAINDTYGHLVGDRVLVEAGQRLRGAVRDCDIVCRIGGDEFVVLTDRIESPSELDLLASHVRTKLTGRYTPPGVSGGIEVSAAVGSSWSDADARDRTDLLRTADAAMYGMKRRNREM